MAIDMRTAPYAALLLRITLGVYFILHLYWKTFVRPDGWGGWWANLNEQGYPDWVVYYVVSGEVIAALCLIPGIFTRWVALYSMPLIVGAAQYWMVRKGFFFTAAGAELPTLWAIRLIAQAGLGDCAYALVRSPDFPLLSKQRHAMPAE